MWKYVTKKQCNDFLLSLFLIDNKSDNEYIKELYSISNNVENNYKVFKVRKRSGGYRTIYEPSETLKYIQRQILKNVLSERNVSKYAKAYVSGISLKENALPHVNKEIILKLDIKNFFDSINFNQVYKYCFSIEYYPKNIGVLLTTLCTYYGYIPQGAPTSSYISNLIMRDFDQTVGRFCEERSIAYTRYSDDMTFSGSFNVGEVLSFVNSQLNLLGFSLNKRKINVVCKSKKQSVTGLVVNEKVQVSRKYKDKIRQEIYYIKKFGIDGHLIRIGYTERKEDYINSLYGKIMFVNNINNSLEFRNYLKCVRELKNRILCRHSRKEYEENKRIYSKSTKRRSIKSTNDI